MGLEGINEHMFYKKYKMIKFPVSDIIFPRLVWHATDKKKRKKRSNTKFKRKIIFSALPRMKAQKITLVMDSVLKTVYGTI